MEDLNVMYNHFEAIDMIKLWCDGRESVKGKKITAMTGDKHTISKGNDKSEKLESAFLTLVDKHREKYREAQLRVWARLVVNGIHSESDFHPIYL